MIKLHFEKLYNRDRKAQPCYVSIPLKKGEVYPDTQVILKQEGKYLPVQKRSLSLHKDGSVRYLFLRFLADIPANNKTEVLCDFLDGEREVPLGAYAGGGENADVGKEAYCYYPLTVEKSNAEYHVTNSKLSFRIKDNSAQLFEEVTLGGKYYKGEQFFGPVLTLAGEKQEHFMQYGNWQIVEEGPVCTVLSCKGRLTRNSKSVDTGLTKEERGKLDAVLIEDNAEPFEEGILCEIRVTAYAERSHVDVQVRLVNATEVVQSMTSLEFGLKMPCAAESQIRTCVAESNYKTDFLIGENGESVEKVITAEKLINQGNEHMAEVFYGTFFADWTDKQGGVCATIYQAQQNFPKAVTAARDGLILKLIPEDKGLVSLQPGMAIEQCFQLYFHEAEEELQEINHQSTMYQMPDRPVLEPMVYEMSGLYPDIFVKKEKQNADVECALIMAGDNHTRSYGMLHWGDGPDPHYTAQGRGKGNLVWTNNEYDFPHACMLQYTRTGLRRFMDYCIVSGTHQRDVDVCHYSKNPLLLGGQWEHTRGHCVEGKIACSHEWVEGLFDCYYLTGDERFLETAIGIGENVLRLLETPMYQKNGGLGARETGWALRTLTALYRETGDEKWTSKSQWIVGQFREWADTYGGWLSTYMDNVVIRVPFMISIAVGSLMRYYREFPDEQVKNMILQAVDDMIENCMTEYGYFYYKELPSLSKVGNSPLILEALAIAYELTGEVKYIEAGKKTFVSAVQSSLAQPGSAKQMVEDAVIVGNAGTKRFAQIFIPMAVYYKALTECNI